MNPIEKIQQVSETIVDYEADLNARGFFFPFWLEGSPLSWEKWGERWRITLTTEVDRRPFKDCNMATRFRYCKQMPAFVEALEKHWKEEMA